MIFIWRSIWSWMCFEAPSMPCPTFDIPQPPCNGKAARCHWGKVFYPALGVDGSCFKNEVGDLCTYFWWMDVSKMSFLGWNGSAISRIAYCYSTSHLGGKDPTGRLAGWTEKGIKPTSYEPHFAGSRSLKISQNVRFQFGRNVQRSEDSLNYTVFLCCVMISLEASLRWSIFIWKKHKLKIKCGVRGVISFSSCVHLRRTKRIVANSLQALSSADLLLMHWGLYRRNTWSHNSQRWTAGSHGSGEIRKAGATNHSNHLIWVPWTKMGRFWILDIPAFLRICRFCMST